MSAKEHPFAALLAEYVSECLPLAEDVAERAVPDVIVEDDCESIGGEIEMTYPRIRPEIKARIISVVIREFGGIDHLPEMPSELLSYKPANHT